MLVVIALGGNALLQRGEPLESELQRKNVKLTAAAIAKLAKKHDVVICHGNGPQVGLLALQSEAYTKVKPYPLDILDAESQGMIGYLIQQELGNRLPNKSVVTLLTQIAVDKNDPAFKNPTKFIGPVYDKEQAENIQKERGWNIAQDGRYWRRVVPSPKPKEIIELDIAQNLIDQGVITIFGGGGGIPVIKDKNNKLQGVEAVIDKDNTASLIATKINADALIILTDVEGVYINWGEPNDKIIKEASPKNLEEIGFASGSMRPKVTASCNFVNATDKFAAIGKLSKLEDIIAGKSGTRVSTVVKDINYY
jgi:carbamate kinase